jgi:hypothetical protein
VRRAEKRDGKMVIKTIKTYRKVSQFWTMDAKAFLAQPVFSRDYPPVVDAGERAKPVPCPEPGIDVEQLVMTVAPVMFEFDLCDAGVVERLQKAAGQFFDVALLDGLDESARAAEIDRMLPPPPRGEPGQPLPGIHSCTMMASSPTSAAARL